MYVCTLGAGTPRAHVRGIYNIRTVSYVYGTGSTGSSSSSLIINAEARGTVSSLIGLRPHQQGRSGFALHTAVGRYSTGRASPYISYEFRRYLRAAGT